MGYIRRREVLRAGSAGLATLLVGCFGARRERGPQQERSVQEERTTRQEPGTREGQDAQQKQDTDEERVTQPEEPYERCDWYLVYYHEFPTAIRREVDAALTEGRYESERLLIEEAIDVETAYVTIDRTPYKPDVSSHNGTNVLRVERVDVVRKPNPLSVLIENDDRRSHEGTLRVTNGKEILSEEFVVEPGEETWIPLTDAHGTYRLHISLEGDPERTHSMEFVVDQHHDAVLIRITEDRIDGSQTIAEIPACSWEG